MQTFIARDQQTWPPRVTIYSDWAARYAAMAASLDMPITNVSEAVESVHDFIDKIDASE